MSAALLLLALLLQAPSLAPSDVLFQAELKKEVTSRRSKPGQEVRFVTTDDVRSPGGAVLIPSGAKLSGKLSVVRKRNGDDPAAVLFIVDKAEWKGGSMPLNASIQQMMAIGLGSDAGNCGPSLNRGGIGGCGGGGGNTQPVPADCKVDKVEEGMAFVCQKHEIELGAGTLVVLRHSPTTKP